MSVSQACKIVGISRSSWYRPIQNQQERDEAVIEVLNKVVSKHRRWGFWKCYNWMRNQGMKWNHKRVHRIYCALGLNLPRRTKKRIPNRTKQTLEVAARADVMWSMDFMHDTLYGGRKFRTLNVLDEGVREALAIEVDTSLPAERVVRVLEQLKERRGLPKQIRVDNGPEFISQTLVLWAEENGVKLHHIQPGKPTQNAYIERFNRTFRNEVLDAYMFDDLDEVRDQAWEWMINYNEQRPHDALGKIPPTIYRKKMEQISTLELSA